MQLNNLGSVPQQFTSSRNIPPVPPPKWDDLKVTAPVVVKKIYNACKSAAGFTWFYSMLKKERMNLMGHTLLRKPHTNKSDVYVFVCITENTLSCKSE